ncbi:transposable element Tcb2 transposase [Trichonephila clavipes]|nr:transposable element Tcb2 transposase [Trichonephila clavipes]
MNENDINVTIGNEPYDFEPQSSDEGDTRPGSLSPNYPTSPTGAKGFKVERPPSRILPQYDAKRNVEVDLPLRRHRRQYEELSKSKKGRIFGMMQGDWTTRRVARQAQDVFDRPVVEKTVTSCRVEPAASFAAVQTQVAPSLRFPMSSRTIARYLVVGHLVSRRPLRVLSKIPTH